MLKVEFILLSVTFKKIKFQATVQRELSLLRVGEYIGIGLAFVYILFRGPGPFKQQKPIKSGLKLFGWRLLQKTQ